MSLLTKDQILNADDLETVEVYVKPWGGSVRIKTFTAKKRDRFEQMMFIQKRDNKDAHIDDIRATLVSLAVVDENGKRIFSKKDIKALSGKSAAAMDKIFASVQKLNAISDEDIGEMVKNSEETQDGLTDGE